MYYVFRDMGLTEDIVRSFVTIESCTIHIIIYYIVTPANKFGLLEIPQDLDFLDERVLQQFRAICLQTLDLKFH